MIKTYPINLTLEELLLIDDNVSEEAQKVINKAKQESTYGFELPIMNEILRRSEQIGKLTWNYTQVRDCKYCDKKSSYHTYPRSSNYHSKGDKNYDKPKYYGGIVFNQGFVVMKGYGDMCSECEKKYDVIHRLIDYIIDNDLKIEIQNNKYKPSKYLKDEIKICYSCDKEMSESTMSNLTTMMGDGYYKGECPHCGAKSLPFGESHKRTDKFDFIDNPEFKEEVKNVKSLINNYNESIDKEESIIINQSKNNNKIFIVQETKWSNGYNQVIKFNIDNKTIEVGYFWKNKADFLIEELKIHGYSVISK